MEQVTLICKERAGRLKTRVIAGRSVLVAHRVARLSAERTDGRDCC